MRVLLHVILVDLSGVPADVDAKIEPVCVLAGPEHTAVRVMFDRHVLE